MGNYQKFRGDPESKLFYLLDGLVGGINTEFSDDASSDIDFDSIVNFDVDKLGTLTKRNGFGKIKGIAHLFQTHVGGFDNVPWVHNITEGWENPEIYNDNLVYVKLLRNDNNCFRNLAAFDDAYAYQKQYGFQNNEFILLMITTKVEDNKCVSSKAWYYHCKLPEFEWVETDEENVVEPNLVFNAYSCELPVTFTWDKTLMNMDSVEYYDDIWFTNNDKALVRFDRSAEINSNEDLDAAFHYVGIVEGKDNEAYTPSLVEVTEASLGLNSLTTNPLYDTRRDDTLAESIQGAYLTTKDLGLLGQTLIVGEPVYLGIQYTGGGDFNITAKNGDTDLGVKFEVVSEISQGNTKFYKLTFSTVPDGEVEITIEKTDTDVVDPYRLYVKTGQPSDIEIIKNNNIGNCGMCMMSDNRVAYYREDTIFFSDVNRPDYLPFNSYLKLPLEPTDRITKICYFKGVYIVFTKESIYKLIGTWGNLSSFACEPVNTSLGCHAGHTVVPIEDTLYFASPRGLYALKSSTFIEGMQNLVELDIKVKKLTSDFTLYEDELSSPSIRFNGINEKAYAFRYRDKYMLFFNSSYEKGDYAAKNNLDTLVYDYTLKSFTTYSFIEKPTFLFMVDNALQTFCTTKEDAENLEFEPEEILNYNFEEQPTGTEIVLDSSEQGNNGTVKGDLIVNQESYSLGDLDYIETEILQMRYDTSEFFNSLDASIDVKLEENQEDKTIFETVGESLTESVAPYSGEYRSEIINGYEVVFRYDVNYTKPSGGLVSENTTLDFTLTLNRTSTDVLPEVSGVVNLSDVFEAIENSFLHWKTNDDGITAIKTVFSNVAFSANFEDALSVELLSDKLFLDIQGGVTETQERNIKLKVDLTIHDYYDYYEKGANVSGKDYGVVTQVSWVRLGTPYSVVAYDGYARFTVTKPYLYHNGTLDCKSLPFKVTVGGKTMSFTMPAIDEDKGTVYVTGTTSKYVDLPYSDDILNGDGVYKVTVKSAYLIDGKLSGIYRAELSRSFSVTLPNIKRVQGDNTTEQTFEGDATYSLVYTPPEKDLYIKLKLNPSDKPQDMISDVIKLELTDMDSSYDIYFPISDITQRHRYSIKRNGNNIELHCDNNFLGEVSVPDSYFSKRSWSRFLFGTDFEKTNYLNWEFFDINFGMFRYNSIGNEQIDETSVKLLDKTGNGNDGTAYGSEPIEYNGAFFTEGPSYIELPRMAYIYKPGFTIETELLLSPSEKPYKIFDIADFYGVEGFASNGNSINISVYEGFVSLNIMTDKLKEMTISNKNAIKYNTDYKLKFVCKLLDDEVYELSLYINDVLDNTIKYRNVSIPNTDRQSCYIGKSNNQNDDYFKGLLHSFKIVLEPNYDVEVYSVATIYEFDTSYSDFDKPIYYELQTKGINLKYPQHIKKLKHIFIKAKGGYKPNDLIFELHTDGYLVNDPKSYYCYVDETGKIVYDYTEIHNLTIDERVSVLGNMTLNNTRLGEGNYQTIKMVIPSKGKNFKLKMYGQNKDYMSLESFGLVAKLGKVKQD